MGEILEISFFMWVIAVGAFAPLGYFIFLYSKDPKEATEESTHHPVEELKYYAPINGFLNKILGVKN